ncbi:carbohydrate-binding protein [Streptacidiphilus sp. PAMC 29251]
MLTATTTWQDSAITTTRSITGLVSATCPAGTPCETESAALTGTSVATNHTGYTGTGFVDHWGPGASAAQTMTVPTAGNYNAVIRYANGNSGTRTLSLTAGGTTTGVQLPPTGNWDTWGTVAVPLTLAKGDNPIQLSVGPNDNGLVNLDSLTLTAPPCDAGTACQAEAGLLAGGAATATNHNGYTGTGFLADLYPGASDTLLVNAPRTGTYTVGIRYANSTGGKNAPYVSKTRTVSLTLGGATTSVQLPVTGNWDTWNTVTLPVTLPKGANPIQLLVGPSNDGSVNIDSITVDVVPCATGAVCEAEQGALAGGTQQATNHTGYTGSGFVDHWGPGTSDTLTVHTPTAGAYTIAIRYANGQGSARTLSLAASGTTTSVQLPVTSSWDTWGTVTLPVTLPAGDNAVQLLVGPSDNGYVNIDSITASAG